MFLVTAVSKITLFLLIVIPARPQLAMVQDVSFWKKTKEGQ
jgi:hypothetical protein